MRPESSPAASNTMTLDAVLARLAAREAVDGILLLGSTATGALTPASDYDLLLVFADLPAPLRLVNTWIDGRLTEVYCTTARAVERIVADPAGWPDASEEGAIVNWLRAGRVAHDRAGRLGRAQETARAAPRRPCRVSARSTGPGGKSATTWRRCGAISRPTIPSRDWRSTCGCSTA